MKKLKELIYDYNDIFLAIIIIAVAAGIIFWRVSGIMNYSVSTSGGDTTASKDVDLSDVDLTPVEIEQGNDNPEEIESGSGEATQTSEEGSQQTQDAAKPQSSEENSAAQKDFQFTIPSGYVSSKIGQKLEAEGICKSEDFIAEVENQKADTKLKAGTFTIPAGSTVADIVKILSK